MSHTGTYGITDEAGKEIDLGSAISKIYKDLGINLHKFTKYTRDTYNNLQEIEQLQHDLGIAQTSNLDEQIAKQAQLARAIADTLFNSNTYNFMSNSATNTKLDPMYTLMDNVQQAFDSLDSLGEKDSKINIKQLNAMLDYVGRGKAQFKQLEEIGRSLTPPMETSLEEGDIESLREAISRRSQEDVDRYNEGVRNYNEFLKEVEDEANKSGLKFDNEYEYLGTSYDNVKDILL